MSQDSSQVHGSPFYSYLTKMSPKRKRRLWVGIALCVTVISIVIYVLNDFGLVDLGFTIPYNGGGIQIIGNNEFRQRITQALDLIQQKDSNDYHTIVTYIGRIEQGSHSGIIVSKSPPTFYLADATTFYSLTWCAGVIAHDAYHSKLFHDYKSQHGLTDGILVPYNVYGSIAAEQQAIEFQLAVMEAIDAPSHEVLYVNSLDGTYCDQDKDGDCDWFDGLLPAGW